MSTDRVSEVGMSSSNLGTFAGTMPSFVSTISRRRLVSVSLIYRNSIIEENARMFEEFGRTPSVCQVEHGG